jgi:dihydrofolate reductase
MRRIVNSTFVSLDGVMNHMDRWHFDYIDDELHALTLDQLRASDALLLGRQTYDIYASTWPGRDGEYADGINAMAKYLASTTATDETAAAWANTTILRGDLVDEVRKLKDADGKDILMHGYGPVAKTLMQHGLVDVLCLWVHPVLAGVGTVDDMVWGAGVHTTLTVDDVTTFASGIVVLTYSAGDAG